MLLRVLTRVDLEKHFFGFFAVLGLNSGPHACQAGAVSLESLLQYFFILVIFEIGSQNYLPRLASNCDPPALCLLSG
jgi:hypothetical protein